MSIERGGLGFLKAGGTPYEIGLQLGRYGAESARTHLVSTAAWRSVMAFRDDPRVVAMRALVEDRAPAPWQEIRGLADGLGLPIDDVFLWNCRGDVWAMAPDGCTTVQIPGDQPVIAHNEDGDPRLRGHCALAQIRSPGGPSYAAFVYPGSIPGHTFAATEAGLVLTVNNLRARGAGTGLPRMVLGRMVLDCATLDEAIRLVETSERAGAFHFTLAQRGDRRLVSLEFSHARCSAIVIERPSCHANHQIHRALAAELQIITDSSAARQRRGDEIILNSGGGPIDPLAVLWDRSDPVLPVHREHPDDPDNENTLATAVFHVGQEAVEWRVHDRADARSRYRLVDVQLKSDELFSTAN